MMAVPVISSRLALCRLEATRQEDCSSECRQQDHEVERDQQAAPRRTVVNRRDATSRAWPDAGRRGR